MEANECATIGSKAEAVMIAAINYEPLPRVQCLHSFGRVG